MQITHGRFLRQFGVLRIHVVHVFMNPYNHIQNNIILDSTISCSFFFFFRSGSIIVIFIVRCVQRQPRLYAILVALLEKKNGKLHATSLFHINLQTLKVRDISQMRRNGNSMSTAKTYAYSSKIEVTATSISTQKEDPVSKRALDNISTVTDSSQDTNLGKISTPKIYSAETAQSFVATTSNPVVTLVNGSLTIIQDTRSTTLSHTSASSLDGEISESNYNIDGYTTDDPGITGAEEMSKTTDDRILAETFSIDPTPSDSLHRPLKSTKEPLESREELLESTHGSLESTLRPLKSTHGPLYSVDGSLDSTHGPLESTYGLLRSTLKPLVSTQTPFGLTLGPFDSTVEPLGSTHGLLKSTLNMLKPMKSTLGQLDSTERPLRSTYASLESTHGPLESTYGPLESTHGPLEFTHGQLDSTRKPFHSTQVPIDTTHRPLQSTYRSLLFSNTFSDSSTADDFSKPGTPPISVAQTSTSDLDSVVEEVTGITPAVYSWSLPTTSIETYKLGTSTIESTSEFQSMHHSMTLATGTIPLSQTTSLKPLEITSELDNSRHDEVTTSLASHETLSASRTHSTYSQSFQDLTSSVGQATKATNIRNTVSTDRQLENVVTEDSKLTTPSTFVETTKVVTHMESSSDFTNPIYSTSQTIKEDRTPTSFPLHITSEKNDHGSNSYSSISVSRTSNYANALDITSVSSSTGIEHTTYHSYDSHSSEQPMSNNHDLTSKEQDHTTNKITTTSTFALNNGPATDKIARTNPTSMSFDVTQVSITGPPATSPFLQTMSSYAPPSTHIPQITHVEGTCEDSYPRSILVPSQSAISSLVTAWCKCVDVKCHIPAPILPPPPPQPLRKGGRASYTIANVVYKNLAKRRENLIKQIFGESNNATLCTYTSK